MRGVIPWVTAMALSALLGACAGPANWTKDGVSPERASADYSECRADAQHDIQRDVNIDSDIAAGRDHDWDHSQSAETHLADDASSNAKLSRNVVSGCMESKGYAPSGPEATESPHWWRLLDL
jgi:hypothetical protein